MRNHFHPRDQKRHSAAKGTLNHWWQLIHNAFLMSLLGIQVCALGCGPGQDGLRVPTANTADEQTATDSTDSTDKNSGTDGSSGTVTNPDEPKVIADGSLSVNVTVAESLKNEVTAVQVLITETGTALQVSMNQECSCGHLTESLSPGARTVYVIGLNADSEPTDHVVTAKVNIESGRQAALNIQLNDIQVLKGVSVSASSVAARSTIYVEALLDDAAHDRSYHWTDNCRGEFADSKGVTAEWSNNWQEDCILTVEATNGIATETASIPVSVSWGKGTALTVAGTSCASSSYDQSKFSAFGKLVGKDGPATKAQFSSLQKLTLAPNNDIYFVDRNGGRVLKVEADTGLLRLVAGQVEATSEHSGDGGPALWASLYYPFDVELDPRNGDLYFAEAWGFSVRKVYANGGTIETVIGTGYAARGGIVDGGSLTQALPRYPVGLALDAQGNIFVGISDGYIYKADMTNVTLNTFARNSAFDVAVNKSYVFAADRFDHEVVRFDLDGSNRYLVAGNADLMFAEVVPDNMAELLNEPYGIAVRDDNTVFIADTNNQRIRMVDSTGMITTTVVSPDTVYLPGEASSGSFIVGEPAGVDFDSFGNLYYTDRQTCQIRKIIGPF